jgi:hypothetical protein
MSLGIGIHYISAAEYHVDPCETPSLSASIANLLFDASPLHARNAHPRLNPNYRPEEAKHLDLGKLCHSLLLEGIDSAVIIDAKNYRTKAAQEQRDAARLAGKCPILAHEVEEVAAMLKACREQLDAHTEASDAFTNGKPEQTLIWRESNGVWCRARVDWLHDSHELLDDFKTTSASANPEVLSRTMFTNGWPIQAAFYLRGLSMLFPKVQPKFRFICQETYAPYALSVMSLDPATLAYAANEVEYAIHQWGECLRTDYWSGYPARIAYAELPAWKEARQMEREV